MYDTDILGEREREGSYHHVHACRKACTSTSKPKIHEINVAMLENPNAEEEEALSEM